MTENHTESDLTVVIDLLKQIIEHLPTIDAIGSVLVRQNTAAERMGLNKNTIPQNDRIAKFEGLGERKTYIEIGDLAVVKQRKRGKNKPR